MFEALKPKRTLGTESEKLYIIHDKKLFELPDFFLIYLCLDVYNKKQKENNPLW